jgi:hypothetical protein
MKKIIFGLTKIDWLFIVLIGLVITFTPIVHATTAHVSVDIRYLPDGVEIARNADGSIKRSNIPLDDFAKIHPCPSTGLLVRTCKNWEIDHVIPLACRGIDAVYNLQWLNTYVKSLKDLFERFIYSTNGFTSKGCYPKIIPV